MNKNFGLEVLDSQDLPIEIGCIYLVDGNAFMLVRILGMSTMKASDCYQYYRDTNKTYRLDCMRLWPTPEKEVEIFSGGLTRVDPKVLGVQFQTFLELLQQYKREIEEMGILSIGHSEKKE